MDCFTMVKSWRSLLLFVLNITTRSLGILHYGLNYCPLAETIDFPDPSSYDMIIWWSTLLTLAAAPPWDLFTVWLWPTKWRQWAAETGSQIAVGWLDGWSHNHGRSPTERNCWTSLCLFWLTWINGEQQQRRPRRLLQRIVHMLRMRHKIYR